MLTKECFNKGIEKLTIEYEDRGFTMTKEKSMQWYEFMKDMPDEEFNKKISRCLIECNHVPYMADVMNRKYDELESNYKEFDFNGLGKER